MGKYSTSLLLLISILLIGSTILVSSAQLGEIAGQPTIPVNLGGSNSVNITVVNQGSTPLPIRVVLPMLNTIKNTTTPIVTASPMNGSIPPNSEFVIKLTVYMPSAKNKAGLSWTGIMQIIEVPPNTPASATSSAQIIAGVAKIVTIDSIAPVFDIYEYLIPAIVIIVIVVVALYLYRSKKAKPKAAATAKSSSKTKVTSSSKAKKGRKRSTKKR